MLEHKRALEKLTILRWKLEILRKRKSARAATSGVMCHAQCKSGRYTIWNNAGCGSEIF